MLLVDGPEQGRLTVVPVIASDKAPPATGRILIPRTMTVAAGEGRNHQTAGEGPGMNHIVGGVPDVFGAQEDVLPQLDGDGLGSGGRAPPPPDDRAHVRRLAALHGRISGGRGRDGLVG